MDDRSQRVDAALVLVPIDTLMQSSFFSSGRCQLGFLARCILWCESSKVDDELKLLISLVCVRPQGMMEFEVVCPEVA